MLKTSGLLQPDERQEELKQVEVYKSHSKFMKTKVEFLCMQLSQHETAWSDWCMWKTSAQEPVIEDVIYFHCMLTEKTFYYSSICASS